MNKGDKAEKRIIKDSLFLSFRHLSGRSAADVRNPSGIGGADEYS